MPASSVIADLRARLARIEGAAARHGALPFGLTAIDQHLPGAGLATGALHEISGSPDLADDASATIFLVGIAARLPGPIFWCLRWRDLFTPALSHAGLHPDRLTIVETGSDTASLIAMEECLRVSGVAAVIGEVARLSTTASKRLQLAAETSGVTALVFRRGAACGQQSQGTAAVTRWRITAAPSEPLGIAALGRARWHVALERVRGGEPKSWIVEACDATGRLALPAALVDRPAAAEERLSA